MFRSFLGPVRFIDPNFRLLFTFLGLFLLLQSLGSNPISLETLTTPISSAGFPNLPRIFQTIDRPMIDLHFWVNGRDIEMWPSVILDVEFAKNLDYLTIILPYPFASVQIWESHCSDFVMNYTSIIDKGNETEIKVKISTDWLDEHSDFYLHYTLKGLIERTLLPFCLSVKHTLNVQTPYIVELEAVKVRVWTSPDLPPWVKVISSNIRYKADIYTLFPARYRSDLHLSQSFSDVPHGSMNLSIEWRPLNLIEIYLRGLWGAAYFFPIYFALASLVFLIIRFRNPSLATAGYRGLLCTFLTYGLTIPIVYWVPPLLYTLGQFFHIPLAYYLAKRLLKKPEAADVALRSSLYTSFIASLPFIFFYFLYAIFPT